MKKGEILKNILEFLRDRAVDQVDFIEAVLVSGYGASMGKIDYEFRKRHRISEDKKLKDQYLQERKRRLVVYISKMKHDGLIKESNNKLSISAKGREKLNKLTNAFPGRYYTKEKSSNSIIISFDIPEKLRAKRNWLREVIKNLDFHMIHQSVWVGMTRIPKDFVLDLEDLKILEYVEIFEISKSGTLKKVV